MMPYLIGQVIKINPVKESNQFLESLGYPFMGLAYLLFWGGIIFIIYGVFQKFFKSK
jgi:hypothetical protein